MNIRQKEERLLFNLKKTRLYTFIIIQDNGQGIARDDLPHIFKRFYKGKNAESESVGIGLAMAHSIIKTKWGPSK